MKSVTDRAAGALGSGTRVVVVIAVLALAGLSATGALASRTLERQLLTQLDRRLIDEARLTRTFIESFPATDLTDVSEVDPPVAATALFIYGDDGRLAHTTAAERSGRTLPTPSVPERVDFTTGSPFTLASRNGSGRYRAIALPTSDGLTIVTAAPLDEVSDTVALLDRRIAWIGALVFVVLAVLIWVIVRLANRRVEELTETAERIGAGDFTARVTVPERGTAARLGRTLNTMTGSLEEAFAARQASEDRLRRFSADASHELRTPLTHIRGYADLLASGAVDDPEHRARAVERIRSEATRMTRLVEELLLLARLDQERETVHTTVDLGELVRDAVADAHAADPACTVTADLPDEPTEVSGDRSQLTQVIVNLLANTRVHTPPETTVSVRVRCVDDRVILEVADDGPGMDADAVAEAFERFSRPEESRSRATGGSGLGLAIVRAIAEAHGGSATMTSSPGVGTTITVSLPSDPTAHVGAQPGDPV